jgi:predicted CoA-substrate-specific enzyme activase
MDDREKSRSCPSRIVGIDAGAVSVSVAEIDAAGEVVQTGYAFHGGQIARTVSGLLDGIRAGEGAVLAATHSVPGRISTAFRCDGRIAVIAAARRFYDDFGAILTVGGERFGILHFDPRGNFRNFKGNTSCAAGTGSFLDQQARRLGLSGPAELGRLAAENKGAVPKIASRCAVFAKTDLVHAQQEGYSLSEICGGVCAGMARNVVDALSVDPGQTRPPVVFAGGVAKNRAVVQHLQRILGIPILVHGSAHLFGAIGAAAAFLEAAGDGSADKAHLSVKNVFAPAPPAAPAVHPPLTLRLSDYPDFSDHRCSRFTTSPASEENPVEVDLYRRLAAGDGMDAFVGIDIGSTSTKAVIIDETGDVTAGVYTRTAGRPVLAVRAVFAAMASLIAEAGAEIRIAGAAATGAGRKFVGKIVGADLIVDEITAHARAALALHPLVDTILEIGGQDSKFTTVKDGRVTFSRMNHVCAAGTGSFIEEQAQRLGCPLSDYAARAEGRSAPATSDRCTVFMERDLNHYLAEGFGVDELLASVLHSVRENYLTKVASEGAIGKTVVFQGATAKNRALVAAFEQRLNRPIHVSKYCHLTGALGAALLLAEARPARSGFRGLGLHRMQIPIRSEVCGLCPNHCKLTVADIHGETVAFGFLCGRDYDTQKRVSENRSGYDLLTSRKRAFFFRPRTDPARAPVVGLPAGLHLYEDLALWRKFFDEMGIATVTGEAFADALAEGKRLSEAEFCAPTTAFYGQVRHLAGKADWVFAPLYLDHRDREKGRRHQFCYYTQYAPVLAREAAGKERRQRVLTPLLYYLYTPFQTKIALYRCLRQALGTRIRFRDLSAAYDRALEFHQAALVSLTAQYRQKSGAGEKVHVVLLGRPYTVLSEAMNKNIPGLFGRQGIRAFFQDMVPAAPAGPRVGAAVDKELHWHHASRILAAAEAVAETSGAYPVLITSFKCAPDSFAVEYFKNLMESFDKPYLILQLDEHDSRVGYETRIEAAVRSFQNHFEAGTRPVTPPAVSFAQAERSDLHRKVLYLPNWDRFSIRLIAAALRREGLDARVLEERQSSIGKSLRRNTGQCLPLNIIAQDFIDTVQRQEVDPAGAVLWMPHSTIACNIRLYPLHISRLLAEAVGILESVETDAAGAGRPKVAVFGDLYARDNEIFNQDLVRFIEKNGGEVVTTPYSEYVRMIAGQYMRKWFVEGNYLGVLSSKAIMTAAGILEKRVYRPFEPLLGAAMPRYDDSPRKIEQVTGIPVASITYDGTGGIKNDAVIPYLCYPRRQTVEIKTAGGARRSTIRRTPSRPSVSRFEALAAERASPTSLARCRVGKFGSEKFRSSMRSSFLSKVGA